MEPPFWGWRLARTGSMPGYMAWYVGAKPKYQTDAIGASPAPGSWTHVAFRDGDVGIGRNCVNRNLGTDQLSQILLIAGNALRPFHSSHRRPGKGQIFVPNSSQEAVCNRLGLGKSLSISYEKFCF